MSALVRAVAESSWSEGHAVDRTAWDQPYATCRATLVHVLRAPLTTERNSVPPSMTVLSTENTSRFPNWLIPKAKDTFKAKSFPFSGFPMPERTSAN